MLLRLKFQIRKLIVSIIKSKSTHGMKCQTMEGGEYGTNLDYLKELSNYWVNNFDWRKSEAQLNRFSNFNQKLMILIFILFMKREVGPTQHL